FEKIQTDFGPGANPDEARGAERHRHLRRFANGVGYILRKRTKVLERESGFRTGRKFANGPLRLVADFLGEEGGMSLESFKQWGKYGFEERFPAGGEVQHVCGWRNGRRQIGRSRRLQILEPEKIHQGKAELQTGLLREIERGGDVVEEFVIRTDGDSLGEKEAAAAVAKKKPAHEFDAGGADILKVCGDDLARERGTYAGVSPGAAAKILAVIYPAVLDAQHDAWRSLKIHLDEDSAKWAIGRDEL